MRITLIILLGGWFLLEIDGICDCTDKLRNWVIGDRKTLIKGWRMGSIIRAVIALILLILVMWYTR